MIALVVHVCALGFASYLTASHLLRGFADRILAAVILFWTNITLTCLVLSSLTKLGQPAWFFRTSLVMGIATLLLIRRTKPGEWVATDLVASRVNWGLGAFFILTIGPLFIANLLVSGAYSPTNWDSLTYHLPRLMYYLGQDSLSHFETNNFRQTFFPFNFNLLQLACFEYFVTPQTVNFVNLASWAVGGLAVFRVSRFCGCTLNGSLIASWMSLISTQILAQATSTTNDLPLGAGLLCIVVFTLRWLSTRQLRDAMLAGCILGLVVGSKLTVVFFAPAGGLIFLGFLYRQAVTEGKLSLRITARHWASAAAIAVILGSSFAVINIAATGHWMTNEHDYALNRPFSIGVAFQTAKTYLLQLFLEPFGRFTYDTSFFAAFNAWTERIFFSHWNPAFAFSPLFVLPPDLNEDHVWFGFIGPFALLGATYCMVRYSHRAAALGSCALLGLGWFAAHFLLYKWSLYNQRYFVPVIMVMLPCSGYLCDQWMKGAKYQRVATRLLFGILAGVSLWQSAHYLFENTRRPLGPILRGLPLQSDLPRVPALLTQRVSDQKKVNIISQGANERIFVLMNQGERQRFTSHYDVQSDAYNIISHWGFTRNNIFSNIAYFSSYVVIPVREKPTAGIEMFGTIGTDMTAFDYFGLQPKPNDVPASSLTSNILVIVSYPTTINASRFLETKVRIVGLNLRDHAKAIVDAEMSDGTKLPLATFSQSGEKRVAIAAPFKRLCVQVINADDGRELGAGEMPLKLRIGESTKVASAEVPPLFSADLIGDSIRPLTSVTGLNFREGPYDQWDLPAFRWLKQPILRIDVPGQKGMKRIRLVFSARMQVRDDAYLGVWVNGVKAHQVHLVNHETWFDEKVVVSAGDGANIIELRDEAGGYEPDWMAYLELYPDVKNFLVSHGRSLEAGAKEHYEKKGKDEHRTLPLKSQLATPPPDGLYFMFRTLRVEGLPAAL